MSISFVQLRYVFSGFTGTPKGSHSCAVLVPKKAATHPYVPSFPVVLFFFGGGFTCSCRRQTGVAQNCTGGVTQVLVHVSTYQGSIVATGF